MGNNYDQLLARPEWRKKTIEILKRDNYTCQRCGVNIDNLLQSLILPKIPGSTISFYEHEIKTADSRKIRLKFDENHKGILVKSNHTVEILNELIEPKIIFQYIQKGRSNNLYVATLGKTHFDSEVHEEIKKDFLLEHYFRKKYEPDNEEIDLEGIYVIDNKELDNRVHFKNPHIMEVHHKCYRKGIEIWEHSNEEYVTLCNICHDIIHENQEIPFFNEFGSEIQNLKKCNRCTGKGYLSAYRHVENGRCFKCNGIGKLEL